LGVLDAPNISEEEATSNQPRVVEYEHLAVQACVIKAGFKEIVGPISVVKDVHAFAGRPRPVMLYATGGIGNVIPMLRLTGKKPRIYKLDPRAFQRGIDVRLPFRIGPGVHVGIIE
jgi:hypothetical protein